MSRSGAPLRAVRGLVCGTLLAASLAAPTTVFGQCTGCAHASFGLAPRSYPTPASYGAALADLDGDGRLDIVVGADPSAGVRAFLGTGTGSLAPVNAGVTQSGGGWIAIADFDRDGRPDVAASEYVQNVLSIFRGNGDGTFQPRTTLTVGGWNTRILAADFNNDGLPDLVILDTLGDRIHLLLGKGDGTFHAPVSVSTGGSIPTGMAVEDFDHDGKLDIAISHSHVEKINLLVGNGNGTFDPAATVAAFSGNDLVAADLNGDGLSDLVLSQFDGILVFRGEGTGTFSVVAGFILGYGPMNALPVDLDQDSILDLAVGSAQEERIALIRGTGNFGFGLPILWPSTDSNHWLLAGDFDADGFPDLAADSDLGFSIVINDRTGRFGLADGYAAGSNPFSPRSGDFDADGDLDLLVANGGTDSVRYLAGRGDGSFEPPAAVNVGRAPRAIAVEDWNGDGRLDAAVTGTDDVLILAGNGDGTFQSGVAYPGGAASIAAADLNGDGKPDLALAGTNFGNVVTYRGVGDGTFTGPFSYNAGQSAGHVVVGDVNGDGKQDLVVGTWEGVSIGLGNGDGTFQVAIRYGLWWSPSWVALGDFQPDGKLDFAVTHFDSSRVEIYPGNGDGTFQAPQIVDVAGGPTSLAFGDWNGDGTLDLAVLNRAVNGVTFLMNSGGSFPRRIHFRRRHGDFAPPLGTIEIVPGDFDGDGRLDFAVADPLDGVMEVFLNTTCEPRRLAVEIQPSTCNVPGSPLAIQPALGIYDDGDNRVTCGSVPVVASLATGPPGGLLSGNTTAMSTLGVAQFSNLSLNIAGPGYRLEFSHPALGRTRSRPFTEGLAAGILGATTVCSAEALDFRSEGVWESYRWRLDGVTVGHTGAIRIPTPAVGSHTIELTISRDGCTATMSRTLTVHPTPSSQVTAPPAVCPYATGQTASVPDAGPGAIYHWIVGNGVITSGAGTRTITFRAGPYGSVVVSATVSNPSSCSSFSGADVPIDTMLTCPPPVGFFTVSPCRLVDTRDPPGPHGGPPLSAGPSQNRSFVLAGRCGIPPTAKALSLNVTVTQPTAAGHLSLFPAGTAAPGTSTINYRAGETRANSAILPLGAAGDLTAACGQPSGSVHLLLDVNGYFE